MVWPLLCSGPAVSLHRERRGFLFLCWAVRPVARLRPVKRVVNFAADATITVLIPAFSVAAYRIPSVGFWKACARLELPGLSRPSMPPGPPTGLTKIVVVDRLCPADACWASPVRPSAAAKTLADWHVRGDDLIAVYEIGQPDAARLDVLWHAATGPSHRARPLACLHRSAGISAHRSARLAARRSPGKSLPRRHGMARISIRGKRLSRARAAGRLPCWSIRPTLAARN